MIVMGKCQAVIGPSSSFFLTVGTRLRTLNRRKAEPETEEYVG